MKKVDQQCLRQDKFMMEHANWASAEFKGRRSYGQMVNTLANMLLDVLVHEGDARILTYAVGHALNQHRRENYLTCDDADYLERFHLQLRKDVTREMHKILNLTPDGNHA